MAASVNAQPRQMDAKRELVPSRAAARLAWSLWGLALLFVALSFFFRAIGGAASQSNAPAVNDIGPVLLAAELALVTVGALVAARRPGNPIGWLLLAAAVSITVGDFADSYAVFGLLARPGALPGAGVMAWLSEWSRGPTILGAFALVFLLFPEGRPLSPRWRPIVWLTAAITPLLGLGALKPGPLDDYALVNNPFGIGGAAGRVAQGAGNAAFFVLLAVLATSGLSLLIRFRRATGDERQQLKWFASGGVVLIVAFLIAPIIWFTPALNGTSLWPILFVLALVAIPLSAGVAILKYHLYDIDLIIRRTLVYSVLSGLLVFVYFGSVVFLQSILRAMTGQQQSQVVVVVSTLGIAALFNPLRRRVQDLIDRAFYRRKYDAALVLAAFRASARDEVELGPLVERLLQAADDTVRPEHVSVWLRPADESHPSRSIPI
jgi:hypothetical protein